MLNILFLEETKSMGQMNYQVCNMDEFIKVSPYAVIYLFRVSIGLLAAALQLTPYISAKALLCVAVYVSGLTVLEKRQTQSKIAKTIGHVTHDALNRLAGEINQLYSKIAISLLLLINSISENGYLILDDVVVPKPFSRYVAGTYMDYDSAQRRHIKCHRIVVVIWTNGTIFLPVAFAFWHHRDFVRKYRTKNDIARLLIYWVVRHRIPFEYVTFDNWYASKQNLNFFRQLGILFVTRLRKNTWIIHEEVKQKVSQLTKYECHRYSQLNAYVRQFEVIYPRFGKGFFALVKNDKHEEPGKTKYLFTNDPALTNVEFVLRYRSRWKIEIFFRTCKQSFGLTSCQAQMMHQVIFHVRMVFLAYLLTQLLMKDREMSMEQMQKHLCSLHCLSIPKEEPKLVSMQEDGTLISVTLDELINPVRTSILDRIELQIPTFIESLNPA